MTHAPAGPSPPERTLAILGYHKVGPPPPTGWETWYYIPEATFLAQLTYLRENGWQVLDLANLMRGLEIPTTLGSRSVLLTFDDGYRSILDCASRCLGQFGYSGVIFVPTAFIGGTNAFDANTREPEERICGWDDLRELEKRGIAVQAHGVTHRGFSTLSAQELEWELHHSRAVLEDNLARPVEVISYPYGDAGQDAALTADLLLRNGFRAACLYEGGLNPLPIANPYRLMRLAMGPDTDLRQELGQI